MQVYVTVHVDLAPHENRGKFNEFMESDGWTKVDEVFTTWFRAFTDTNLDASRAPAIASVRRAARAAEVSFKGVIVPSQSPPERFDAQHSGSFLEEMFALPRA